MQIVSVPRPDNWKRLNSRADHCTDFP